jgi:DNA-binding GntR family transcriptional regulator
MADAPPGTGPSLAEVRRLSPSLSLANRGTGALREMILSGILRPGQRLNEVELSTALGISRAPLREAIRDLASQGLLTIVTHKGAYVPSYTSDDLRDIYEVRIAVEAHAVRLLALRRLPTDLAELRSLLDQTEQALRSSDSRAYPSDLDFHRKVMELTGNQHLIEISTAVGQKIQLARIRSGHVPERAQEALNEHREIVNCLSGSDANTAAVLMTRHLQQSLANVLRVSEASAAGQVQAAGAKTRGGPAS